MDAENKQHLELAFALEYATRIVAADGVESYDEFRMLGEIFPRPLLRQAEFLDDDGRLTERFREYQVMAHNVLPSTLSADEKRDLMQLLFAASVVDELAAEEMAPLMEAGVVLGMSESDVTLLIGELSAGR
jgi:hypothetical protein